MATTPKTFLLVPSLSFSPEFIRLGDIVKNPTDPTNLTNLTDPSNNYLSRLPPEIEPDVYRNTESLWVDFLKIVGAKIGGVASKDVLAKYSVDCIKTYRYNPTPKELDERLKDPNVRAALNRPFWRKELMYIVTGLKVACGFKERKGTTSTDMSSSMVNMGTEASVEITDTEAGRDIIFAYQLTTLELKRWRQQEATPREYTPGAFF